MHPPTLIDPDSIFARAVGELLTTAMEASHNHPAAIAAAAHLAISYWAGQHNANNLAQLLLAELAEGPRA